MSVVTDFICRRLGGVPTSYAAIDTETTGFSFDKDVIVEFGYCLVLDGRVADRLALVIDWTGHDIVAEHWLDHRLRYVANDMATQGLTYHHSIERMREEGVKPAKALWFMRDYLAEVHARGIPFVAHNGFFDEAMLAGNLAGFSVDPEGFSFGDDGWIDTSFIEKALTGDHDRLVPKPNETLRAYYQRVKSTRITGLKSNMDHCFKKYGLENRGADLQDMHGAAADAYCCHLLTEIFFARNQAATSVAPAAAAAPTRPRSVPYAPPVRRVGQRNC